MPNRISASVGDHLCFILLFITMIRIDCKITNFSLYLFVRFFTSNANRNIRGHIKILFGMHPALISRKSVSLYALYSLIFSPLHNREKHKSFSTNNPAITEKQNVGSPKPDINQKVGVLLNHVESLHFISSYFEHFE